MLQHKNCYIYKKNRTFIFDQNFFGKQFNKSRSRTPYFTEYEICRKFWILSSSNNKQFPQFQFCLRKMTETKFSNFWTNTFKLYIESFSDRKIRLCIFREISVKLLFSLLRFSRNFFVFSGIRSDTQFYNCGQNCFIWIFWIDGQADK